MTELRPNPDVSVIVVNWNTRQLLADCLASLYETIRNLCIEVIVVDNGSSDGSVEMLRQRFPRVRLIANRENKGFTGANNQALDIFKGRYALLFNSDAVALPSAIEAMVHFADKHPKAGVVGAQLLNTDGTFQASHTDFPTLWQEFLILTALGRKLYGPWYPSHGPRDSQVATQGDYVEGACMLVRRKAFEAVGGLDEGYFMYAEEVDWCFRIKQAGWEVWYLPEAQIVHHGGASSRRQPTSKEARLYRSRVRFFRLHYGSAAAMRLKALIFALTLVKRLMHGTIKLFTRGRYGRDVVSWRELRTS
jgi:hypothetical protein